MDVTMTTDAATFAAAARPYLAVNGVRANVVASVLGRTLEGTYPPTTTWLLVTDGAAVVGAAMHGGGHPPYLPPMPDEAAAALARALLGDRPVEGVNGDAAATDSFVAEVGRLTGAAARRVMAQGVFVLGTLVPPDGVPGCARASTAADADACFAWMTAMREESMPHEPPVRREHVAGRAADGAFVLWQDGVGVGVGVAGIHGPDVGVGRIGPVYTPPEQRRHGYAAAVTAFGARRLLDAGAEAVMLFTDLANPTSNGVYARIGFQRVGDASMWLFTPATHPGHSPRPLTPATHPGHEVVIVKNGSTHPRTLSGRTT